MINFIPVFKNCQGGKDMKPNLQITKQFYVT